MAAVSYGASNDGRLGLLNTCVALHPPSCMAAAPIKGLASMAELAAVFRQHSVPNGSTAALGAEEHFPYHLLRQSNGATQHPAKVTDAQQLKQETESAAEAADRQQQQLGSSPGTLNHRSSSRRRKPKVSCNSAYGPNDNITNSVDNSIKVKTEPLSLDENIPLETVVDGHGLGMNSSVCGKHETVAAAGVEAAAAAAVGVGPAAAAAYEAAVALYQQQRQQLNLNWTNGYDTYGNHPMPQQQQVLAAAGRAAGSNSRKRAASSSTSGRAATAVRLDPAEAAVYRISGSGDLSGGTDHSSPMFGDHTICDHLSREGSTAAAAAMKGSSGNKQERLKEKNRLAQRRFRARQKTMLEHMQIRMEQLAKQIDHRTNDLTVLQQDNSLLKSLIQEQQKVLMSAMAAQQQQQHGLQNSVPAAAAAQDSASGNAADQRQQYQQLQQLYEEHWRQQQQ